MGDRTLSRAVFTETVKRARASGGTTAEAERQFRATRTIDENVDPKTDSGLRRSLPRFIQKPNGWMLTKGVPMNSKSRVDATSSMGTAVDEIFDSLLNLYELLTGGQRPVLGRYDTQIANCAFNDRDESPVITRSQYEMADKIALQLTKLIRIYGGGDPPEDPHYDMFGDAYLVDDALSRRWGLLGYDFTITDAPAREWLDLDVLLRIYGDGVFAKAEENGFKIDRRQLPTTAQIVKDLLKRTHAFVLQVRDNPRVTRFWSELYGRDRVIILPSSGLVPLVQVAVIGLTEGVIKLTELESYLVSDAKADVHDAATIVRAVSGIPVGAQMRRENFNQIPKAGDIFAEKTDTWPIGHPKASAAPAPAPRKPRVEWT